MRIIITLVACLVIAGFAAAGVMPVIVNPGFEEGSSGWGWYSRAKCTYAVSTENPHSGKQCIVFHDESPLEPEVYGRLFQVVGVLPGTEYELSVWVVGKTLRLQSILLIGTLILLIFQAARMIGKKSPLNFEQKATKTA